MKAALEETSMLLREKDMFVRKCSRDDGWQLWQKNGRPRDFVELVFELIPPSLFSFLSFPFRVSLSPSNI